LTVLEKILGGALKITVGRDCRRFEKKSRNIHAVQEQTLLDILSRNRASDFGRRFGFSKIRNIRDFQRALPVGDYETVRPYIDRVKRGDERALYGPGEKVAMFALTSGTTGLPKCIPVTETFIARYRMGWRIWGGFVLPKYPDCFDRHIMQVVSPKAEKYSESGLPCGSISGLIAEMQKRVVKNKYALPHAVSRIEDIELKLYISMRLAILKDVSFLTTANPSTILQLVQTADKMSQQLVKDVADGTCTGIEKLEKDIREDVSALLKRNVDAARNLQRLIEKEGGLYPKDYWPNLRLIGCWKGGPLKMYTGRFERYFGAVGIRDIGLMASEGRITIPMEDEGAGPLDIENSFFEFIPEESIEDAHPDVLLGEEIEVGKKYFVILTTSSGLCRYNISDVIEVVDVFHRNPVVRFLNKGNRISNITGEKVSEYQVICAMEKVREKMGVGFDTFSLCLCIDETPYYCILVESDKLGDGRIAEELPTQFDRALAGINIEYEKKRRSRRLRPVSLRIVAPRSFETMRALLCRRRQGSVEQYKHPYLLTDPEWADRFEIREERFAEW